MGQLAPLAPARGSAERTVWSDRRAWPPTPSLQEPAVFSWFPNCCEPQGLHPQLLGLQYHAIGARSCKIPWDHVLRHPGAQEGLKACLPPCGEPPLESEGTHGSWEVRAGWNWGVGAKGVGWGELIAASLGDPGWGPGCRAPTPRDSGSRSSDIEGAQRRKEEGTCAWSYVGINKVELSQGAWISVLGPPQ